MAGHGMVEPSVFAHLGDAVLGVLAVAIMASYEQAGVTVETEDFSAVFGRIKPYIEDTFGVVIDVEAVDALFSSSPEDAN